VAHACDPSYSRGRDQEDLSSKPGWANSSQKIPLQRRAGGVAQGVGPEFKPQYHIHKNIPYLSMAQVVEALSSSPSISKKKKSRRKKD
jgi:hypothetical protein